LCFSLILKMIWVISPLNIDFFIHITKIYSFIQFVFNRVTSISQLGYKSYMLTQVGSYRVFSIFFRLFFSLIFPFHILFARNWALIFFFYFVLYEIITFSFIFFPSLSDNILQHLIFFKIVFFFNFIIYHLIDRERVFMPFVFSFFSMGLFQYYANIHGVKWLTWFD